VGAPDSCFSRSIMARIESAGKAIHKALPFAFERTSTNAVTWWFAPLGGLVAAYLIYALGVPMTFSHWLPDNAVLRAAFDVFVLVIAAYAIVFCFWLFWYLLFGHPDQPRRIALWAKNKLNWYLVAAVSCAAGCALFIAAYWWDRSRGPIIWTWNENAPLAISVSPSKSGVAFFQFIGTNRWDAPIIGIKTWIRSMITGAERRLMFVQSAELIAP
jgi:hypothetical protein